MGVYIPNMSKPKDCYLCEFTNGYECWSNGEPWFDVKEAYAKKTLSPNCPLIEIVRCGECEYADEYNHCKYSEWWNGNADFCSHGIRRKENR